MKTFITFFTITTSFICFSQKVSDTTFTSKYGKNDNIKLTKRFMNQISDVKSIEFIENNNGLTYDLIWFNKTSYEVSETKEIIQVDARMKFTFIMDGYDVRIEATAVEFLQKNKSNYNSFILSILNNNVQEFFRNFINFMATKNPNENLAITESVEILRKAENQQDVAVGIWLGSGIISGLVLRNNPADALIISGIGGISGLIVYISSRVNKRKGLRKLQEAA